MAEQNDLNALRTDQLNLIMELQTAMEALSARVQGMEGDLLQVHHNLKNWRNGEDALRTEVKEIQDSRTGMTQKMDLRFRRVADQIGRTKPAKRKNSQPKAYQIKETKKRDNVVQQE